MKTYKGIIETLPDNGIFVFGSNTQGRHGKGAALVARQKFGAIYGQAEGRQGNSYAIVTKDLTKYKHPSVTTGNIEAAIRVLYHYAINNPTLDFYIAYSGTGVNLNGYSNEEMAYMFSHVKIPDNIVFEENFYKFLKK